MVKKRNTDRYNLHPLHLLPDLFAATVDNLGGFFWVEIWVFFPLACETETLELKWGCGLRRSYSSTAKMEVQMIKNGQNKETGRGLSLVTVGTILYCTLVVVPEI